MGSCLSASQTIPEQGRGHKDLMCQKEHGTCAQPPPQPLRWNVDWQLADRICCFTRSRAEPQQSCFGNSAWLAEVCVPLLTPHEICPCPFKIVGLTQAPTCRPVRGSGPPLGRWKIERPRGGGGGFEPPKVKGGGLGKVAPRPSRLIPHCVCPKRAPRARESSERLCIAGGGDHGSRHVLRGWPSLIHSTCLQTEHVLRGWP